MRSALWWFRRVAPALLIGLAACTSSGEIPAPLSPATPEPTLPPTSAPTEEPVSCLEGDWTMSPSDLDLLVATLLPATRSFMRIENGGMWMHFEGGQYEYGGQYVMHVDSGPGAYTRATAEFKVTGPFTLLDGSMVSLGTGTSEYNMLVCQAFKDGQRFEVPCDSAGAVEIQLPAEAPYRCAPDRLELDTRAATGNVVTMFFDRSTLLEP